MMGVGDEQMGIAMGETRRHLQLGKGWFMKATAYISLVLAFSSFLCGGCATIMTGGGHTQSIRVASTPPGAMVYADDNFIGLTPISSQLTRSDDHKMRIELAGYESKAVLVTHGPNLWTIGNVLFGGIIGVGVDLFSGADEGVLSPGNINQQMTSNRPKNDSASDLYRYGGFTPTGGYVAPSDYQPDYGRK
jgi:hypothetical protein